MKYKAYPCLLPVVILDVLIDHVSMVNVRVQSRLKLRKKKFRLGYLLKKWRKFSLSYHYEVTYEVDRY